MTVKQLLENLDSNEMTDWMAFYSWEAKAKSAKPEPSQEDLNEQLKKQFGFYRR
jgi:hypothetical protein